MGLGPHMALPLHQKRIDFHFAHRCAACFIAQFVVSKEAYGLGANSPVTPASSKASRAADLAGLNPLIDHPLGTIQRLVPRVVTNRISNAASWLKRYGRTPYCTRTDCFLFRLRGLLELPTLPFFSSVLKVLQNS